MSEARVQQAVKAGLYLVVTGSVVYLVAGLADGFGGWRSFGWFLLVWSVGWGGLATVCYGGARVIGVAALIDRTLAEHPAWRYLRWPVWGGLGCLAAGTVVALFSRQTVWEASTEIGLAAVALPVVLAVTGAFWGLLGLLFVLIEEI